MVTLSLGRLGTYFTNFYEDFAGEKTNPYSEWIYPAFYMPNGNYKFEGIIVN